MTLTIDTHIKILGIYAVPMPAIKPNNKNLITNDIILLIIII